MKVLGILLVLTLVLFGIMRHDVKEEEYIEFTHREGFDSSGVVINRYGDLAGSGTLIDEQYVLTAAHLKMVRNFEIERQVYCQFEGKKYKVSEIFIPEGHVNTKAKKFGDIAVMRLEKPVKRIEPAKLYSDFDELGKEVAIVGYGYFGHAIPKGTKLLDKPRKLAGMNVIDSIGGEINHKERGLPPFLFADFDHPTDSTCCNRMGSAISLPLEYITAGGDSGGGLFIMDQGEWKLAGVCSAGYGYGYDVKSDYGLIGYWTRVSVFQDWIKEKKKNLGR